MDCTWMGVHLGTHCVANMVLKINSAWRQVVSFNYGSAGHSLLHPRPLGPTKKVKNTGKVNNSTQVIESQICFNHCRK